MTDPIVTHEDLTAINVLVGVAEGEGLPTGVCDLLERLRAAAEADTSPLPEGWVLLTDETGNLQHPYWHEGGRLHSGRLLGQGPSVYTLRESASDLRDRLTPLRPAITGDDLDRAVDAYFDADDGDLTPRGAIRAAFAAAGVVIEP